MKAPLNTVMLLFMLLFALTLSLSGPVAQAQYFMNPSVGAGYNSAQGSYFRLGLDIGMYFNENVYAGFSAFYGAGEHAENDREIGAGPFIGYVQPIFSFLTGQVREDLDYVDVREPVLQSINPDIYSHNNLYGIESVSYAGLHLAFTRNFGISGGYRLVVGLSNSSIASGRSGLAFGVTLGF